MFFTYVMKNPKGILYKGHTANLKKRIVQHTADDGFSSYTKKRGPWTLVYFERFVTRKEAEEREKFFKTGKGRDFLKSKVDGKSVIDENK